MRVSVFGMGYVGSVSSAALAGNGHTVVGVEIDPNKLQLLHEGRSPVVEPGLEALIRDCTASGRLRVTSDPSEAVLRTDLTWICVGTPGRTNGSVDLRALEIVCQQIGQAMAEKAAYHTVVLRSTVLPGTVRDRVIPWLEEGSGLSAGEDFGICMSPEFLREGSALKDFTRPAFTLIGEFDPESGDAATESYEGVEAPVVRTNLETAEMVKYVGNAFHALKVVFANEIGNIAKAHGIDGQEVMELFGRDKYLNISTAYLKPGFAFGGSCLPKDTRALVHRANDLDIDVPVLEAVMESNEIQIRRAIEMVEQTGLKKVGVLGLSFKPGTDDVRESPVVPLIETLVGRGYEVLVYDEDVQVESLIGANKAFVEAEIPHIASLMRPGLDEVVEGSEVVVVSNASKSYEDVLHRIRNDQLIIDLVGIAKGQGSTMGEYEGICW